jgi:type IV pilus assembly protein PilE
LNLANEKRESRGFTLIEVMIVVAIVAILASIAYPSYQSAIRKSRRSDATIALNKAQQLQETYRANNTGYAATLAAIGASTTSDNSFYTLSLFSVTPTGFTLVATAVAGKSQAADTSCTPMTISKTNASVTYGPAGCWN